MDKDKKRFLKIWAFFSVFVFLFAFLHFTFAVSADVLTVVDLSREQTLALYGTQIAASYFTGSEWRACTFEYYGSSTDFLTSAQEQSNYKSNLISYDNLGYTSSQIDSLFRQNEFLFYRCLEPSPSPSSSKDVIQFNLPFSVAVDGVAYFRQIIGIGRYWSDLSYVTNQPSSANFGGTANVSFSGSPVSFSGKGISANGENVNGYFELKAGNSGVTSGVAARGQVFFSMADFYLQDIDSNTGLENTFSVSGQSFFCNHAVAYPFFDDPISSVDGDSIKSYFILCLSTPRVTDGYVLPDNGGDSPNYSGVLDDISGGVSQSNSLLQQILLKLDAIYSKMSGQGVSISGTVEIGSSSITNIGVAIGSAVGSAIRDLFVPSQSDLLAWRLNMQSLAMQKLDPFVQMETIRDTGLDYIMHAAPVGSIDLPVLDLTSAGIAFDTESVYTDNGFPVVDGKARVPLKVTGDDWAVFYEFVAWFLDIVCTLAFVNMCLNKMHAFFLGDKVVEVDGVDH